MIHTSAADPVESFPDLDIYDFLFNYFPPTRPDLRDSSLPLLIDEETAQSWTFGQIKQRVDLLSLALEHRLGLGWDERVASFAPNSVDFPIALWATLRIGGVLSAANPAFGVNELVYQLKAVDARILFVGQDEATLKVGLEAASQVGLGKDRIVVIQDPASVRNYSTSNYGRIQKKTQGLWTLAGLVEEGRNILEEKGEACLDRHRRFKPNEEHSKLALLSFSSGTTGLPKGVAITHKSPIANILQFGAFNRIPAKLGERKGRFRPGVDVSLGVLPQFHIYGLIIGLHTMFFFGISNVVIPRFRGIEAMVKTMVKYSISIWWLVPPQVVLLCKDPSVKPYLDQLRRHGRFVMVGAAPLSDDLSRQFEKLFPQIDFGQGSGMTETCTVTTMHPLNTPTILGSAGRLISNTEARVVDSQTGQDCPYNTPGELWIRGPQNAIGYYNNENATREMWVEDGWIRTGDEVVINEAGDVRFVDRLKELIKVKGFQVAPAELEGAILNHEAVADVGVVGVMDEEEGETPLAFVVWKEEARRLVEKGEREEEELKRSVVEYVKKEKVRYKWLGGVVVLEAIPKTASGKILRRNMRDMAKQLGEDVTKRYKVRRSNGGGAAKL